MSYEEAQDYWDNLVQLPPTRKRRVFLSHPYADNPAQNKLKNLELLYVLKDKYPDILFISPLLLFDYLTSDDAREDIMMFCKGMIMYLCDEVWSYGDSEGCKKEIEYAKKAGVPVYKKG